MLSFFPRGVLDAILNLIESVSKGFPSYSLIQQANLIVLSEEPRQNQGRGLVDRN